MSQRLLLLAVLAGCGAADDPVDEAAASLRPSFTSTATAAPSPVAPGAATTITAHVTDTGGAISGAIVDIEIYDAGGHKMGQGYTSNVRLGAGKSANFTYAWTATTSGSYTIEVGVFNSSWSTDYHWNNAAGTITVAPLSPSFTSSATASPATVAAGAATQITAIVDNSGGALSGAIVDLEVYSSAGAKVAQDYFENVALPNGARSFEYTWTAAAAGSYTIMVGVFNADWSINYSWNSDAGSIVVGGASCTPTTCAAQGKSCGSISDGCGGTLTCGSCTAPQTCGGGGSANVCGQTSVTSGSLPAGWLFTKGNKIYVSDGKGGGGAWMGRGVNVDDIYFCGYNNTLWMSSPESDFQTMVNGVIANWKANFVRVSLSMNSNATVSSWLSNPAQYQTPMTTAIDSFGANPGVYVLVTLRSDSTMKETDSGNEATYIPTTSTDAVYRGLVDSFASSKFVLFGLSNEPGTISAATLVPVMSHAVGVIRAEEDRLGVPHHLVSVQGRQWTSDISFYSTSPLPYDNVVYEVHGYPPSASSYTYSNIPVILGEYGTLSDSASFFADVEAKQIPNLAWDYQPYSDCAPDLLNVTQSATNISPSAWGNTVKAYLAAH